MNTFKSILLATMLFASVYADDLGFSDPNYISQSESDIRDVSYGDVNGDGHMDVLTAITSGGVFGYFLNDGSGNFGDKVILGDEDYPYYGHPNSIMSIDIDGDGILDVLGAYMGGIVWFKGEGNGDFDSGNVIYNNATWAAYAVTAGDIDGDGDTDITVPAYNGNNVNPTGTWVFVNNNMSFTAIQISNHTKPYFAHLSDIDSDGDLDIVTAHLVGASANPIAWHENLGGVDNNISFNSNNFLPNIATAATSVSSGDFNNDGHMDIVSSSRGDGRIIVYHNNGNSGFDSYVVGPNEPAAYNVESLDFNNDGFMDLVSISGAGVVLFENGGDVWPRTVVHANSNGGWAVDVADIDGDGSTDIVSAFRTGNTLAWYENLNDVFQPQNKPELQTAVDLWVSDNETALSNYG